MYRGGKCRSQAKSAKAHSLLTSHELVLPTFDVRIGQVTGVVPRIAKESLDSVRLPEV